MKKDKTTDYRLFLVHPHKCDAIKDYLENMALQGWKLKDVFTYEFEFEKIEPTKLSYAVDVFSEKSFFNTSPSKKALDYIEFCKDAGWEHICTTGYINYFVCDKEELQPITTNQKEKFNNIVKASRTRQILLLIFLIISLLPPKIVINTVLAYTIMFMIYATDILFIIPVILDFAIWYFKQRENLKEHKDLEFVSLVKFKKQNRNDQIKFILLFVIVGAEAIINFISKSDPYHTPFFPSTASFVFIWGLVNILLTRKSKNHDSHMFYTIISFFLSLILFIAFTQLHFMFN